MVLFNLVHFIGELFNILLCSFYVNNNFFGQNYAFLCDAPEMQVILQLTRSGRNLIDVPKKMLNAFFVFLLF